MPNTRLYVGISLAAIVISLGSIIFHKGLNLGVDFTGGHVFQVKFHGKPDVEAIRAALAGRGHGPQGPDRGRHRRQRAAHLPSQGPERLPAADPRPHRHRRGRIVQEETVGPTVGADLKKAAIISILLSLILMVLYIWFRFGRNGLGYGVGAVIALGHDAFVTLGLFSLMDWQVGLEFVAAILTIIGYSVNDTIVIFDRVRELVNKGGKGTFATMVSQANNETFSRTIIISLIVLVTVIVLAIFGGSSMRDMNLAMIIGVIAGGYSTIAIACPFVVWWDRRRLGPPQSRPVGGLEPPAVFLNGKAPKASGRGLFLAVSPRPQRRLELGIFITPPIPKEAWSLATTGRSHRWQQLSKALSTMGFLAEVYVGRNRGRLRGVIAEGSAAGNNGPCSRLRTPPSGEDRRDSCSGSQHPFETEPVQASAAQQLEEPDRQLGDPHLHRRIEAVLLDGVEPLLGIEGAALRAAQQLVDLGDDAVGFQPGEQEALLAPALHQGLGHEAGVAIVHQGLFRVALGLGQLEVVLQQARAEFPFLELEEEAVAQLAGDADGLGVLGHQGRRVRFVVAAQARETGPVVLEGKGLVLGRKRVFLAFDQAQPGALG